MAKKLIRMEKAEMLMRIDVLEDLKKAKLFKKAKDGEKSQKG